MRHSLKRLSNVVITTEYSSIEVFMKKLKIATLGTPADYPLSLVPLIIRHLGYEIQWSSSLEADLLIYGPFYKKKKDYPYLPKPLRPMAKSIQKKMNQRASLPVTLFQTGENIRHDFISAQFSLSFDLTQDSHHYRFPYWVEMVDWSHEGVVGNINPRFGQLLSLDHMMQPLGAKFLDRNHRAAFITSHLLEPRKTIYTAISTILDIDGFGPYFNSTIKNHLQSGFVKSQILQNFSFNLCPENGLYPGYYTEKIPEAFLSGCLPLTWTDTNVKIDFNPLAMINLQPMMWNNFEGLKELLHDKKQLQGFAEQPLIIEKPSIQLLKEFIQKMIRDSLS